MFENSSIRGIHKSRYIASWIRSGGDLEHFWKMDGWLKSLGLTEEERDAIRDLATNGKLELEISAKCYMKRQIEEEYYKQKE